MAKTEDTILTAALVAFSQFGYAKTTMGDIAREAQVARATVYNAYASKSDVLRAVVLHVARSMQDDVIDAWSQCADLDAKLDAFLAKIPLAMYDQIQSMPQAAELMDEMHSTAAAELAETRREGVALLETMLRETGHGRNALDFPALADFVYATGVNAKYNADNRDQVVSRLAVLKQAVLGMFG